MVVSLGLNFLPGYEKECWLRERKGVKSSGYGRFGASGLEEWVRTKTVTFRDWAFSAQPLAQGGILQNKKKQSNEYHTKTIIMRGDHEIQFPCSGKISDVPASQPFIQLLVVA